LPTVTIGWLKFISAANLMQISPFQTDSWFPPSHNVGNVRNLVNVGRWRNGHTLRTLLENMETKLHQWFLLVNSYGFYVKNRNRFYSYRFHVYVTYLPYMWKRIRENFHVYVIFTLPTLTTYVTWRWKSRVRYGWKSKIQDGGRSLPYWIFNKNEIFAVNDPCMTTIY